MAIDPATNQIVGDVAVGKRPWGLAVTPDASSVYVANGRSNSVSVIDASSMQLRDTIAVGELPWGVAIR
jgi:YVTN family beta-propeller protein